MRGSSFVLDVHFKHEIGAEKTTANGYIGLASPAVERSIGVDYGLCGHGRETVDSAADCGREAERTD